MEKVTLAKIRGRVGRIFRDERHKPRDVFVDSNYFGRPLLIVEFATPSWNVSMCYVTTARLERLLKYFQDSGLTVDTEMMIGVIDTKNSSKSMVISCFLSGPVEVA